MLDKFANIPITKKQEHFDQLNAYKEELRKEPELRSLFLEMTLLCNEHCLHCGSLCGDTPLENGLSDYEILQTLIQLKEDLTKAHKALPFLNITGGEPLLRKNLTDLMKTIHSLGYCWGMTTNGTLIDQEMAERLKDAGIYSVSISLDGLEETHNWFRQTPDAYQKALDAVDHLLTAGIQNTMITTVVHKRNISELDQIEQVVIDHHCTNWRIINIEPIGRALTNPDLMLEPSDYQYIIEYIKNHQENSHYSLIFGCNHYLGLENERKTRPWYYFCRAGLQVASIQYNGDISACLDIERRPELIFGNVRKDSFLQIWNDEFGIYREHKERTSSKCKDCNHQENCQGGGYHTWNFDEKNPRICMLEQLGIL